VKKPANFTLQAFSIRSGELMVAENKQYGKIIKGIFS
jgi:hypothetical protein